jgi:hypothetical protein
LLRFARNDSFAFSRRVASEVCLKLPALFDQSNWVVK